MKRKTDKIKCIRWRLYCFSPPPAIAQGGGDGVGGVSLTWPCDCGGGGGGGDRGSVAQAVDERGCPFSLSSRVGDWEEVLVALSQVEKRE